MKEKFWKYLKSKLCPRDGWVADEYHTKCQCCGKYFIRVLRRRHHCRFCGKLFCSNCSDFYINGKYLGLVEKFVRHCEFCRDLVDKMKKNCNKLPALYNKSRYDKYVRSDNQSDSSDDDDNNSSYISLYDTKYCCRSRSFTCLDRYAELDSLSYRIDLQMREITLRVLRYLLYRFTTDWSYTMVHHLLDMVTRAVVYTKMYLLPTTDQNHHEYMDVLRYVKIKTISNEPRDTMRLVPGIILYKMVPIKSMKYKFRNAQVLIIYDSIDVCANSSDLKFYDLLAHSHTALYTILYKIIKLNPDVVFVYKTVSFYALEYFNQQSIAVISKLRRRDVYYLMRVTGIRRTVKNIAKIDRYKVNNIIGKCDMIHLIDFDGDRCLLFVEKENGIRSLLLSYKTEESQSMLKKAVQVLLRLLRQIHLEKFLVMVDAEIGLDFLFKPECPILTGINYDMYNNMETYLNSQYLKLNKISYYELVEEELYRSWVYYTRNQQKIGYYEICGSIESQNQRIYAMDDMTIAEFMFVQAAIWQKQCDKCQHKHMDTYYFPSHSVSISIYQSSMKRSYKYYIRDENDLTTYKLGKYIRKHHEHFDVWMYFLCEECGTMVSLERRKVEKEYLKNSLFYMMSLLRVGDCHRKGSVRGELTMLLEGKKIVAARRRFYGNKRIYGSSIRMEKVVYTVPTPSYYHYDCNHNDIVRVLYSSDLLIKFFVYPIDIYQLTFVYFHSYTSKLMIEASNQKYLREMINSEITSKQYIITILLQLLNKFNLVTMRNSGSITSSTYNRHINQKYYRIISIVEKVKEELSLIYEKYQTNKYLYGGYDWTIFTRKIQKIESVLKIVIYVVLQLGSVIPKKKIEGCSYLGLSVYEESVECDISMEELVGNSSIKKSALRKYSVKNIQQNPSYNILKAFARKVATQRFPKQYQRQYQDSALFYPIAYSNNPVSVLACALNSVYFRKLHNSESNLYQLCLRLKFYKSIKTSWYVKTKADKLYADFFNDGYYKSYIYEITAYFHREFEQLRQMYDISFTKYVRSLCGCVYWNTSGGKSDSLFAKSYDEIVVVKTIKEKEFVEFHKFAREYLNFVREAKAKNMESLLAKIFGVYYVTIGSKTKKCVVMQNIFFGVTKKLHVYDLKGSYINRFVFNLNEGSFTGLDNNFKIDRDSRPYTFLPYYYTKLMSVLRHDTSFLYSQSVIDYSLLVVYSPGRNLRIGIIDFMRPYHLIYKIESILKYLKNGQEPTVVRPDIYAYRFFNAFKKYFMSVVY